MRRRLHRRRSSRGALVLAAVLVGGGSSAVAVALSSQVHAPQPTAGQAGRLGGIPAPAPTSTPTPTASGGVPSSPSGRRAGEVARLAAALARRTRPAPTLARSRPVALRIPAIGVSTSLLEVGRSPNGTIQVPPLFATPSEAAWYRGSPTPGQLGPSVIVGHVDNVDGPAVFFRLGALVPGDRVEVTLADGTVARFVVDGVRRYDKTRFPTATVYGATHGAALRLITCGGPFDASTGQYVDNVVVFASLVAPSHPGPASGPPGGASGSS